ncbi:unnamed protein product [Discula destructiva]
MQFKNLAIAALASVVSAGTVTFQSMDNIDRTVVWTGSSPIEDTFVPGGQNVSVTVPTGYVGNVYSYCAGETDTPGMLAEFAFNSWASSTFFDVSAIVDQNDHSNVYQMYPADTMDPVSGCDTFACANAYYLPDDIQTKSTTSDHIIVTLGGGPIPLSLKRDASENHPREAVTDPHYRPALKARFKSALRWASRN